MFVGAIFQTIRGIAETILSKKKINKLEDFCRIDILELIPEKKHLSAKILLKQAEYQRCIFNNVSREFLSDIEKEILGLMEKNIDQKKKDLAKKKATQLDIANLLLTIQKFSHETLNEHHKHKQLIEKNVTKYETRSNKILSFFIIYSIVLTACIIYLFTLVK